MLLITVLADLFLKGMSPYRWASCRITSLIKLPGPIMNYLAKLQDETPFYQGTSSANLRGTKIGIK